MKRWAAVFGAALLAGCSAVPEDAAYRDAGLPVERRVADLLGRMTSAEKAALLAGDGWMTTAANPRLGIPALKMTDGSVGVRVQMDEGVPIPPEPFRTTAFPAGIALAASFDPELVREVGGAIARDARALGRNMLLGPAADIARAPLGGRTFESYGEDPFLAGSMTAAYVRGAQAQEVIATIKHLAANNQETARWRIDARVDARALHEIYLPPFRAAVREGGVRAAMSAYNRLNGPHGSENAEILIRVLRERWGFGGLVVSDWGSTYSTAAPLKAGLNVEMPGGPMLDGVLASPQAQADGFSGGWLRADRVLAALRRGKIAEADLDRAAGPTLATMFATGLFERPADARIPSEAATPERRDLARRAAASGIVLLKNDAAALPLNPAALRSLAVIGPNAAKVRAGGGSSKVEALHAVAPLDAIRDRLGPGVRVDYALGASMDGEDPAADGTDARDRQRAEAVRLAAAADAAVVIVGRYDGLESEGFDIRTLDLPSGQDELIAAVAAANPRTVVVLNTGAPVAVRRWVEAAPALLTMWYGGEQGGPALAAALFGDTDPGGRLPITFPRSWPDSPVYATFPGRDLVADYAEGIFVGYRHFDARGIAPQFPFGHGLSYTRFAYSDLAVAPGPGPDGLPARVRLSVRNVGDRPGVTVPQLYVHDGHAPLPRPPRELKGFQRLTLAPGEGREVEFTLDRAALSYYDPETQTWTAAPGRFRLDIGASSRDIRLSVPFELVR